MIDQLPLNVSYLHRGGAAGKRKRKSRTLTEEVAAFPAQRRTERESPSVKLGKFLKDKKKTVQSTSWVAENISADNRDDVSDSSIWCFWQVQVGYAVYFVC